MAPTNQASSSSSPAADAAATAQKEPPAPQETNAPPQPTQRKRRLPLGSNNDEGNKTKPPPPPPPAQPPTGPTLNGRPVQALLLPPTQPAARQLSATAKQIVRETLGTNPTQQQQQFVYYHPPPPKRRRKDEPLPPADLTLQLATQGRQQAQADLAQAEAALKAAKQAVENANSLYTQAVEVYADSLLARTEIHPDPQVANFMRGYRALVAFKQREGHTAVKRPEKATYLDPNTNAPATFSLGRFAYNQRVAHRDNKLEPYKKVLLERIQFEWTPKVYGREDAAKWEKNYEALKAFAAANNGSLNVPQNYENPKLYNWIRTVRGSYRTGHLSKERIEKLNKLNFDFGEDRAHIPWEARLEQLKQYKQQHGHTNVKWRDPENLSLAGWVVTQRNRYSDMKRGKPSTITQEQIEKLESIGFEWSAGGKARYER